MTAFDAVCPRCHGQGVPAATSAPTQPVPQNTTPPAVAQATTDIENAEGSVWLVATAPLLGLFLGWVASLLLGGSVNDYWWLQIICNIGLIALDVAMLKKMGVDMSTVEKWALVVPAYLFMRAGKLKQQPIYAWVWIVLFVVSLLPAFSSPPVTLDRDRMKTEIRTGLDQQLAARGVSATCTDVTIVDKNDHEYEGLASFSDGSTATIDITLGSDGTAIWKVRQ